MCPVLNVSQRKGNSCHLPASASSQGARSPAEQVPSKGRGERGGKAAITGILTSTIFSLPCTQTYAIPFNFLSTVIVNEKQYCNTSNYNQISVLQDASKRKEYIYGCEEPLISVLTASHMAVQQQRGWDSLSFLSPVMHFTNWAFYCKLGPEILVS